MSIPFQGNISRQDLVHMYSLAIKKWRILSILCAILFVCLGIIMLIYPAWTYEIPGLMIADLVLLLILGTYYFWMPYLSAWIGFRNNSEMHSPYRGTISQEEVQLNTVNTTNTSKWTVFHRVERDQKYVLLFLRSHRRMFLFFPRTFFSSEEDWQNFQDLLDSKVQSGVLKERGQPGGKS